ncbi:MAG: Fic family protein [Eubacterium sp.]
MNYIKVSQVAEKWGLSARRVRILCQENKIEGVIRKGNLYMIPESAQKPADGRRKKSRQAISFERIEELKTKLDTRRPLTQGELERLNEEFMIEFTYNSNAIEGNTLTLQETAMVLEGITIDQKPLKDHWEAVGHKDAFLYVQDIVSNKLPLTEFVIKNIHSLVLMNKPEDKGVYRRVPVRIMGAYTEPVQPYMIEPKITELLAENEKRKDTMNIIERIARFHLEFESIHPFIDGNGRTGRLLMNFELMQNGYPPINVKFTDRKRYYDAFESYSRNQDAKPMTNLIAEYVAERLYQYLRVIDVK